MKRSTWIKLGVLAFLIIGLGWIVKALGIDLAQISPERVREFVLSFGVWAPAVYLLVYAQPIIPLPASIVTITAGLAFGPWWGTLAAVGGAAARAYLQFFVARLLGREAVSKLLKGKVAALDQKIGENGFKTVLLVRLIPNFPYDVQNYGLGFSQVRFGPYALATLLGILPASFALVYLGHSITDPKHLWKLVLATVLMVGLTLATRAWKTKRGSTPSSAR